MSSNKRDHLVISSASALAGATLPMLLSELPPLAVLAAISGVFGILALWLRPLAPVFWVLLGFSWVCGHAGGVLTSILPEHLERQPLVIEGRITDLPRTGEGRTRVLLDIDNSEPSWIQGRAAKVILNCYRCRLKLQAGERWRVTVKLKRPSGTASPGAFDYEKWLFRQGIVATGYIVDNAGNRRLASAHALNYQGWRSRLRIYLLSLPGVSPRARGMFRALLIGDRGGLTNRDWAVLRATGISHLVAISGLHIGLIMLTVSFLFRYGLDLFPRLYLYFPRVWFSRIAGVLAAMVYAALAGFAIPTLRALLMIGLFITARLMGRDISLFRLLFATVALLLLFDPFVAFDASFWLSFGAVFIIALGADTATRFSWLTMQPRLWLSMMPLLILFFSYVSLVAPRCKPSGYTGSFFPVITRWATCRADVDSRAGLCSWFTVPAVRRSHRSGMDRSWFPRRPPDGKRGIHPGKRGCDDSAVCRWFAGHESVSTFQWTDLSVLGLPGPVSATNKAGPR